jgi:hypothetical protein
MNPYVKSIQFKDNYCLLLTFENGEKRTFDLKPYFEKPVFAKLKNAALFKTARVVSGSVEWQGEIDLSYDTLYLESKTVKATRPQRRGKKNLAMAAVQKKKLPKARAAMK